MKMWRNRGMENNHMKHRNGHAGSKNDEKIRYVHAVGSDENAARTAQARVLHTEDREGNAKLSEETKTNTRDIQDANDNENSHEAIASQRRHDEKTQEVENEKEISNKYNAMENNPSKEDKEVSTVYAKGNGVEKAGVKNELENYGEKNIVQGISKFKSKDWQSKGEVQKDNEENDILLFLRACEEGRENGQNCEYVKSFLNSEKKSLLADNKTETNVPTKRSSRNEDKAKEEEKYKRKDDSEDKEELLTYIKACEDGKLDEEHCESLKSLLILEERLSINAELKSEAIEAKTISTKRNIKDEEEENRNGEDRKESEREEADRENEDREEKERKEQEKKDDTSTIGNDGERTNEVWKFLKECTEGKEAQQDCDSLMSFLKPQDAYLSHKVNDEIKNNTARYASKVEEESSKLENNVGDANERSYTGANDVIKSGHEVSQFLKECQEGKENIADCESLKSPLKSQREPKDSPTRGNKTGDIGSKKSENNVSDINERNNMGADDDIKSGHEMSQFLKECDEGKENKEDCESLKPTVKSQREPKDSPTRGNKTVDIGSKNSEKNVSDINERNNTGADDDIKSGHEVSQFLKECEEGKENKEDCESFKSFLKSQGEPKDSPTRGKKRDDKENVLIKDTKKDLEGRDQSKSNHTQSSGEDIDEITQFLKECKAGEEDQDDCESFISFLKSQKRFLFHKNNKANMTSIAEKNSTQNKDNINEEEINEEHNLEDDSNKAESEQLSFLKDCEEGKEEQRECESFTSYLKSQKKFPNDNFSKEKVRNEERSHENSESEIHMNEEDKSETINNEDGRNEEVRNENGNDEEYDQKVLIFLKRCEEGKENKEDCEALKSLLQSQQERFVDDNVDGGKTNVAEKELFSNEVDNSEGEGHERKGNAENGEEVQKRGENDSEIGRDGETSNGEHIDKVSKITLKACKEGKEDEQYCESFRSFMKSQQDFSNDHGKRAEMTNNTKRDESSYKEEKNKADSKEENVDQENLEQKNTETKHNSEEDVVETMGEWKQGQGEIQNKTYNDGVRTVDSEKRGTHIQQENSRINSILRNLDKTINYDRKAIKADARKAIKADASDRKKEQLPGNRHKTMSRQNGKARNRGKRQAYEFENTVSAEGNTRDFHAKRGSETITKQVLSLKRNNSRQMSELYAPNADTLFKVSILQPQRGTIAETKIHLFRTVQSDT